MTVPPHQKKSKKITVQKAPSQISLVRSSSSESDCEIFLDDQESTAKNEANLFTFEQVQSLMEQAIIQHEKNTRK